MPDATPSFSMFHRRLVLLFLAVIVAAVVLVGQLGRLTLAQGAELREDAEAKLVNREWVETIRGKILDRKGRVLAQDRPSFNVSVDFRVISGDWARRRAGIAAKKHRLNEWGKLSSEERQALIDTYVPIYQEHVDRMWDQFANIAGMTRQEVEEKKSQILKRVGSMKTSIYAQRLGNELNARLARGEEISADLEEETIKRLNRPIVDQRSPQVVIQGAGDDAAFEFMRLAAEKVDLSIPTGGGNFEAESLPRMPGLTVTPSGEREYPMDSLRVELDLSTLPPVPGLVREGKKLITVDGVAYHVLGSMKDSAQKEDSDRRRDLLKNDPAFAARVRTPADMPGLIKPLDRGEYQDDDRAGKSGIESSREEVLRGLRGLNVQQLDTGEERKLSPERGKDVQLTLDINLQARVQAAMSPELGLAVAQEWHGHENPTVPLGTPLNGAAVVLEVDSGDILALVSTPSISRSRLLDHPEEFFEDPLNVEVDMPWLDRAIARPYPPGSIAKALILNGAVKLGKHSLDTHIDCTGHLFPDKPKMFRCWALKQFQTTHTIQLGHALSAPEALMVSCNIYFFTLGQKLGPADITNTYAMFVLGQRWNLGVGVEYEGEIGERLPGGGRAPLAIQDAIQMGIGQGPVE